MTVLLALNMTVAVGLINSLIFYANIAAANESLFFSSPDSNYYFPRMLIAWLNLDIGIDVCFIKGLNAYYKLLLQLAFPIYIISLVVFIIKVSEWSSRFAKLIGRRDPIATLATLILLSYTKLLSITIAALSPVQLQIPYQNGPTEWRWRLDANMMFFQGKYIAVGIIALLIILIGVPFTALLFG